MQTSAFVILTVACVSSCAVYLYRARREVTDLTAARRALACMVFAAVGLFALASAHEAFTQGHVACGRARPDCHRDTEPFHFWAMSLFFFLGGVFGSALVVVALIRRDDAGDWPG